MLISTPRRLVAASASLLLLLAGCSFGSGGESNRTVEPLPGQVTVPTGVTDPAADPALAKFYGQELAWSSCDQDFDCASLTVPVDWAEPGGETLKLAVKRLPAAGDTIGSLVINPGGPGASGLGYADVARQAFGRAVLASYDVVGFDPRGVGESDPVKCLSDSQYDEFVAAEATPDTASELAEAISGTKEFAAACERNTGALLGHVDSLSAAKDMDVLRQALGDAQLSYFGASYGTFLGAWYAETFPWRVGRLVLDGAVDPSSTTAQYTEGQARGFSRALNAYVKDCLAQDGCPLRGSQEQALDQIGDMVKAADTTPLRTNDSRRDLTQALMVNGIAQALYNSQAWPILTQALTLALQGDGTTLLNLSDQYYQRDAQGKYGQTIAANPAIFCLDSDETRTPAQIESAAETLGEKYPPLGEILGWGGLTCSEWPIKNVLEPQELHASGAAPILVLGTVNDPATPYEWAEALASQLDSGHLVTWEGDEHTAYHRGVDCVDDAVENYLLSGALPAEGLRCAQTN